MLEEQEGATDRGGTRGFLANVVPIGIVCVPLLLGALGRDYIGLLWRTLDLLSVFRIAFLFSLLASVVAALRWARLSKDWPSSTIRGWGLIIVILLFVSVAVSAVVDGKPMGLCFLILPACLVWSAVRREVRLANPAQSWTLVALALLAVRATFPWLLPNGWPLCAYDEGFGTWVWICIHALGCLVVGRLWAGRRRFLSILLAVTWTLALFFFLHNDQTGGHDLLARWR